MTDYTIYLIAAGFVGCIGFTVWKYIEQLKGELKIEQRYRKVYADASLSSLLVLLDIKYQETPRANATVKRMSIIARNGIDKHHEILMEKGKIK